MKNTDKLRQLNENNLAMILMCPKEYDENYNKTDCSKEGCYKCTLNWLKSDNGWDFNR